MKTRILAIATGLGILAGATSAFCSDPPETPEPEYKGKALSDWAVDLEQFDRDDTGFAPPADAEAVVALHAIGPAAVPHLLKWLAAPELMDLPPPKPSRDEVVMVCRVMGTELKSAIPGLAKMAAASAHSLVTATNESWETSNDHELFDHAVVSLALLGPEAVPVMLTLTTNLQGRDLQLDVIKYFGETGTNGSAAVPALVAWSRDKDCKIRDAAVEALVGMQSVPEVVLPTLLARLEDPGKRWITAVMLGEYGRAAIPAIPALIKLLDDPDVLVRGRAINALGHIGGQPEIIVPLLAERLHDEDSSIQANAAYALGNIGGKAAFEALMTAVDDPDELIRQEVLASL